MQIGSSIIGRGSRSLAMVTGALLFFTCAVPPVLARQTQYQDVPAGAYYEQAAVDLLQAGALSSSETYLRPADLAQRSELVKLLINLQQTGLLYPTTSSFNDVSRSAWYFPYMEAAANAGWVHGDGNCYQQSRPCYARPAGHINRAEAAALLVRTFSLERTNTAPTFPDNPSYQWYYPYIQAAADHCVLQGDDFTGLVRPASDMNRAEMVVMADRANQHLNYGTDCGTGVTQPQVNSVVPLSSTQVRVTFSANVDSSHMQDESRYTITRASNGTNVSVRSATRVSDSVVDLALNSDLVANVSYRLAANGMLSQAGVTFSDTAAFLLSATAGQIISATPNAPNHVRVTFDTDLNSALAQQASRYQVTRVGGTDNIPVHSATVITARTVDLMLDTNLIPNVSYTLAAQNLQTSAGVSFSDSMNFVSPATIADLTTVSAVTSIRLRLAFDADLDDIRAEDRTHYIVADGLRSITISSASMVNSRTVELVLSEAMVPQRMYTVGVNSLLTLQGISFSATGSVIYNPGPVNLKATLTGNQQVPSVTTAGSGTGTFILTSTGLQYDLSVLHLSGAITAAHFHVGAASVNGSIIVPITFVGNHATGTWNTLTLDQRNALLDGNIYVSVQTVPYPNGEIRGQIIVTP